MGQLTRVEPPDFDGAVWRLSISNAEMARYPYTEANDEQVLKVGLDEHASIPERLRALARLLELIGE